MSLKILLLNLRIKGAVEFGYITLDLAIFLSLAVHQSQTPRVG
jgi:hypothetical protein